MYITFFTSTIYFFILAHLSLYIHTQAVLTSKEEETWLLIGVGHHMSSSFLKLKLTAHTQRFSPSFQKSLFGKTHVATIELPSPQGMNMTDWWAGGATPLHLPD